MKRIVWNKDKKMSPEFCQKISLAKFGNRPTPHAKKDKKLLEDLYLIQRFSAWDIAKQFNIGRTTVYRWLEEFSIKRRDNAEAHNIIEFKKRHTGKNHPCYKTGKFTQEAGNYIYIRYNGKMKPRHRVIFEKALNRPLKYSERVHHINKNRQDDRLKNLILFTNDKSHMHYHKYLENR